MNQIGISWDKVIITYKDGHVLPERILQFKSLNSTDSAFRKYSAYVPFYKQVTIIYIH